MNKWTVNDIPDQTGRVAIVTGANTGIGFETAAALAAKNATVVMACRNQEKAESAIQRIRERTPAAIPDGTYRGNIDRTDFNMRIWPELIDQRLDMSEVNDRWLTEYKKKYNVK